MQRRSSSILLAFCILLVTAGVAFAAAEHGAEEAPNWKNFIYRWINFILFIGVIAFFAGKKIKAFFKGRTLSIGNEISTLETRKAQAQQELANVEKRIANLETERQAILNDYRAQGEALKASIIAQAEKSAAQTMEHAKSAARNEVEQAVETIRAELAEKVMAATEKLLVEKLTPAEHSRLVDKYLTKVVLN